MTGQETLVPMATARFGVLLEKEIEVLTAAEAGPDTSGDKEATADRNRERGTVRAPILRWLCIDEAAGRRIDPTGLKVKNALIEGDLDLNSVRIPFALVFDNCDFAAAITLLDAECRTLEFESSTLVGIVGDRLSCRGGIWLTKCTVRDKVRLVAAKIVGDITFGGSQFNDLSLDAIEVRGKVLLDDGFICRGTVRLPSAQIYGDLGCRNALFAPPTSGLSKAPAAVGSEESADDRPADALVAAGIQVGGDVFFDEGFRALGPLHLQRARIGGSLQCDGGTIESRGGVALSAIFASVGKEVRMGSGFIANGEVDFNSARVQGQFNCEQGQFLNPCSNALTLDGAHIEGLLVLRRGLIVGALRLTGARLEDDLSCVGATFVHRDGCALLADRSKIAGSVDLGQCRIAGQVSFMVAAVGSQLGFAGARLLHRRSEAFTAQGLTVQRGIFFTDGFQTFAEIDLSYSTINLGLECTECRFSNRFGTALCLRGASILGDMKLLGAACRGSIDCESVRVEGDVRFFDVHFDNPEPLEGQEQPLLCFAGASVRGDFEWREVSLSEATAVTLAGARVGTLLDEASSWPLPGLLDLRGFHYENLADIQPLPQSRLAWLERQPRERFSVQPFEELIAWARRNGQERAAVRLAIAREDARRLSGQLDFVQSVWNRFLGVAMAHGFAPFRVLYAALFFVLAGWGVFAYSSVHGAIVPSKLQEGSTAFPVAYPAFSPFMYSLDTFVPIIDFYQESYWLPSTHTALGRGAMIYLWFHIVMGWAVSSLAVIGFSGLVRRE